MAEAVNVVTGRQSLLNGTGSFVVKAVPGVVHTLAVNTTGAIKVYDCATTGTAAAGTLIFGSATLAVGVYKLDFPCLVGLTVIAGSGVVSLSYD